MIRKKIIIGFALTVITLSSIILLLALSAKLDDSAHKYIRTDFNKWVKVSKKGNYTLTAKKDVVIVIYFKNGDVERIPLYSGETLFVNKIAPAETISMINNI